MTTAEKNKNTVLSFYKAIDEMNVDGIVNLFSEDSIHVNPYHSNVLPEGAKGKEGVRNYWTPIFEQFEGVEMKIEEIYAMEDPNIVYVKAKGKVKLTDGSDYNNDYYKIFKFNEKGEIKHYSEVFNPIVALQSFNLVDKLLTT
nr:hypothetical protein BACY1_03070 [Tenacibaculum mesophilum]